MKTINNPVPSLRFPEFTDEWEVKTINDLGEVISGSTPTITNLEFFGGDIIWITPKDLSNHKGIFISKGERNITEKGRCSCSLRLLPQNSVLFTSRAPIGYIAIAQNPLCTNQGFKNIIPNNLIYSLFLYYLLEVNKKHIITYGSGGTFKEISLQVMKKITVYIPCKKEQQKIADCLASIDELITLEEEKLTTLNQYKKGLMQKIFPQSESNIPELRFPEFQHSKIEFKNGNELFEIQNEKVQNNISNLPVLAISQQFGAIPREKIDYTVIVSDESLKNYKIVQRGNFIISLRSFQGGIEYSAYNGICSPAYIILRSKKNIFNFYYKFYFKTKNYIRSLTQNLEGIRDGKMISYNQFSEVKLPVPSISEQKKIADFLSSVDELIENQEKKIEQLKQHKNGLLQGLFPNINGVESV